MLVPARDSSSDRPNCARAEAVGGDQQSSFTDTPVARGPQARCGSDESHSRRLRRS